jgi:hypothetical protein
MRDPSEGRLGHGLAARSSRGGGSCAHQHGHRAQVGALTGGKVLGWSTTVTRQMHQARRAEVGLTEEVGRRWGGGKRPARWRSAGGQLWSGGGILGGGPAARGGGEGGDAAWCRSGGENTTWGRKNPTDGSGSTLLKGAAGTQWREAGESRAMHGGARGGGSGSHRWVTARVARHSRQRHGRGVCGCRRVADEQGPDGSERAQGEWGVGACGLAGEGNGVG